MFREEKFESGLHWFRSTPDGEWQSDSAKNDRMRKEAPAMYEALGDLLGNVDFGGDRADASCHVGITTVDKCCQCQRVLKARAILERIDK